MVSWSDGETSSASFISSEYPEGGIIPESIEDPTWCGIALDSTYLCFVHKEQPEKRVAYQGRHTGRRFLACALENEVQNCGFVEWIDHEWPDSLEYALSQLWSKVDELTIKMLEEHFDHEEASQNLRIMEKKYNDLKAEVNKTVDETVNKVQVANYYASFKEEEKDGAKFEACVEAKNKVEAKVAELVEDNKKLLQKLLDLKEVQKQSEVCKEVEKKIEGDEIEALKMEKKRLEHALFDLFNEHHAKKEKLEKIEKILHGSN